MNSEAVDQFLERARKTGLIDDMRTAAITMLIDADRPDLPMALQLGLSLLWEKPLLLIVKRGQKIPQRVRDLADEIVEFESGSIEHPVNQAKTAAAIARMVEKIKAKEKRDAR